MTARHSILAWTLCLLAAVVGYLPTSVEGQAYCSLRDPNRIIQEIFPEATGFRSHLRKVTPEHARTLKLELPIDFDSREFTTHTMYAVHQNRNILGYVQSRTEEADWGLAEIIWILDPDLKLSTFRFQRCRSRWKSQIEGGPLQQALKGLSEEDLLKLWESQGSTILIKKLDLPPKSAKLVEAVIKSGFKALGLARVVWGNDIEGIRTSFERP